MNDNVWFNPSGYQRTSKSIQKRCLSQLLSFAPAKGAILDVGCGTGNALLCIEPQDVAAYVGVDISPEMIGYATDMHEGTNRQFEVADFLEYDLPDDNFFDIVICAACLHWFIPQEQDVITKIAAGLRPQGQLYLSCAHRFDFFEGEKTFQRAVLEEVRDKYQTITAPVVFDDYRFDAARLQAATAAFDLVKIHRIEEAVDFDTYEDFRDWHLGSGSVLYQQFAPQDRHAAVRDYYERLYEHYLSGRHTISYATALMLLEKRGA